jgi:hypothetical protein
MEMTMRFSAFALLLAGLPAAFAAPPVPARQPVYVEIFSRIDDHLNLEMTEDKIRRAIAAAEALQARHPSSSPSITLEFTGAAADAVEARNRGTGLANAVREAALKGLIRIGYDGRSEPAPAQRPIPNFRFAKTPADRWLARQQPLEWFLTEYKDPLTGDPDPARSGGLKRVLEIFGKVEWISGVSTELGGDPEEVHLLRRMNITAMLAGLPEGSSVPARNLHGYGGSVLGISDSMSAVAGAAPEVFWQDGYLRLSDANGGAGRILQGSESPDTVKKVMDALDRSKPHVLRFQFAAADFYVKPDVLKNLPGGSSLRYAYENPKVPFLATTAWKAAPEREAAFQTQDALLRWFTEDFFSSNPGSRFVAPADLMVMAGADTGREISREALNAAIDSLLARWSMVKTHPPTYAAVGESTISLAETFQILAAALAERHRTGALPASNPIAAMHGPLDLTYEVGPGQGIVAVLNVLAASAALSPQLRQQGWSDVPHNAVPTWIEVGGQKLNAAQFLHLMALSYRAADPKAELPIELCNLHSEQGLAFPYTRRRTETGATWTLRPAVLHPR